MACFYSIVLWCSQKLTKCTHPVSHCILNFDDPLYSKFIASNWSLERLNKFCAHFVYCTCTREKIA